MGLVDEWSAQELSALQAKGLARRLEPLESAQGPVVRVDGQSLINFSSNDYLGLANHESVRNAARLALEKFGVGSGASRLVVGDTTEHQALEAELARFEGTEAALLFNTGYATERKNKAGNGARGRVPSRCAEATRGRRGESGTGAEGERARLQTDVGRGGSPRQRRDVSLSQPAAGRAERWRAEGAVAATGDGRAG